MAQYYWGVAVPSKIAWVETTNVNSAELSWWQSSVDNDKCASTSFYDANANPVAPDLTNYDHTKTTAYYDFFTHPPLTRVCINQQGVATHEMGHTMGLDHEDSSSAAVMRTYIYDPSICCSGQSWTVPKQDDKDGINSIY